MSMKAVSVLSVLFLFSAASVAEKETFDEIRVSSSVLVRLANVEDFVKQLKHDNKKLRQENKELIERLDKVEAVCQAQDFQILANRKRLKTAEKEIEDLKIRDRNGGNRIYSTSGLHETNNSSYKGLKHNKAIKDPIERHKAMKKPNAIRPSSDVRRGSISQRLLLPMSTPATLSYYKGPRISFSAHIIGHLQHLGATETLKFPNVNDNEGAAYDSQTGVFICPMSGTYHFEATIMSFSGQRVDTSIMLNGHEKARMVSEGSNGHYGQSSNSINIRLTKGDHVWIQHINGAVGTNVNGDLYSHFGGFILWED